MPAVGNPLRSKTSSFVYKEIVVDIACASFCDRNFVAVTQFKRLGTLISVTSNRPKIAQMPSFQSNVILGKDEIECHVFSRAIAEVVFNVSKSFDITSSPENVDKPILCTFALKEFSPELLNKICEVVKDCDVWK